MSSARPETVGPRSGRRWRSGLVALAAVAASLAVPPTWPAAAAAPAAGPGVSVLAVEDPARIFQFNLCGAVRDNDDCSSKGGTGAGTSVPAVVSSLLDYRPDIVTLNEVCENQFSAILQQVEAAGYTMDGRFGASRPDNPTCEGSADYGNAVLSRLRIANAEGEDVSHPLPLPDGAEVRQLLCVDTALRGRSVKACATHLSSGGGKQAEQVRDGIMPVVNPWLDAGIPVLIGGDFNADPDDEALDPLYNHDGGTGRFREVDETDFEHFGAVCRDRLADACRSGEGTHDAPLLPDSKIDYIFVSEQFAKPRGDATTSPTSDHDPLRGTAVMAAGPPVRVFQFNMKGVIDEGASDGSVDVGAVPAVVESIRDFHPDIVTLNELCRRQFDALAERFAAAGWRMYGMWDGDVQHDNCGPGEAGKALFSRDPVVGHPNVTEHMGCASTRLRGRTTQACVLHLPTDAAANPAAAAQAAAAVEPYAAQGFPVLLAGDFNALPDDPGLDSFYSHNGGTGRFHEVDETDRVTCPAARESEAVCRAGEVTFPTLINPRKLDFIFVNDEFTDVRGDATSTEISDHVPYRGWASVLPGPGEGSWPGGDAPPGVDAGPPVFGDEGAAIDLLGSASDDGGAPDVGWSYAPVSAVDAGATCSFGAAGQARTTITCTDDGVFRATLTANDGVNGAVSDSTLVTVRNVAPTITANGPAPWSYYRIDRGVTLTASFTDPGSNDTHTCTVDWDDGGAVESYAAEAGSCDRTHRFAHAGMYTVGLTVRDDDGGSDTASTMVIVYDPWGGFTNADGSVTSAAGNYRPTPGATGELWFDLSARYYPVQNPDLAVGTGKTWLANTDFRIDGGAGNLQWLVVTPDGKTAAKGTGNWQGRPGRYGFVFYGYDGCADGATPGCRPGPDRFRVVVWSLDAGPNPGSELLYDNVNGGDWDVDRFEPQALRSGIVTLHPPT